MKAVLISIRPEWCEKIASGEKTIEVRKTRPKLPTPFKCYIYCTTRKLLTKSYRTDKLYTTPRKDLSELLEECGNITFSGKVIGEFVCDETYDWHCGYDSRYDTNCLVAMTCLDAGGLYAYGQGKPLYGWHISDLKIYDTPMRLQRLYGYCWLFSQCETCGDKCPVRCRPPQSFCYVEELT